MPGDDTIPQVLYMIGQASAVGEVAGLLDVSDSPESLMKAAAEHATEEVREHVFRLVALRRAGFTCHVGAVSLDTLDRFRELPLTLVIMDVAQPGRKRAVPDEVVRRASAREIPVVMLTNDAFNVIDGAIRLHWPLPKSPEALTLLVARLTSS